MANHKYTLVDLTRAVTHALAGAPDANLTPEEVVNDSLSFLASLANWRWKQRELLLNSTNGQGYINLPADFVAINTIKLVGVTARSVAPVTLDQLIQMRESGGTINDTWYCLDQTPQTSVTVEPVQIIRIYPTPTSTTTSSPYFMTGTYLRQFPKLTGTTDVPDIPSQYHPLLKMLCRAMAVSQEEQQRGADWEAFWDMLPHYLRLDGEAPGYLGRARGGLSVMSRMAGLAAQTNAIG